MHLVLDLSHRDSLIREVIELSLHPNADCSFLFSLLTLAFFLSSIFGSSSMTDLLMNFDRFSEFLQYQYDLSSLGICLIY